MRNDVLSLWDFESLLIEKMGILVSATPERPVKRRSALARDSAPVGHLILYRLRMATTDLPHDFQIFALVVHTLAGIILFAEGLKLTFHQRSPINALLSSIR